jgi:hypothetical protein
MTDFAFPNNKRTVPSKFVPCCGLLMPESRFAVFD